MNATKRCLYALLSTSLLLGSAACNAKKTEPTPPADSTVKAVDANATKVTAETEKPEAENTEADKSVAKGDLIAFELMGNVKECKWTETDALQRTYTFDANGHLTKVNKKAVNRVFTNIKRDKKGRLLSNENSDIQIIQNGMVHMANLACFVCKYINGVANLHTEILKSDTLNSWYKLNPNKFQNKTNGITQRRFLRLCNPKLSELITDLLGSEEWITDLSKLKELEKFADNKDVLDRFMDIKKENKKTLSNYILKLDNDSFSPDFIVDSQIKRLHEYKRQFLNILVILELYFELEEKSLTDFTPTVFIFGAKSAPGYERAKGIIKLINEVKRLVEANEYVSRFIKIIFVSDYSVSYAEKIIPATDISKQISTAGTEASGTGNMKFMLNGAVTLGTFDGANIEIVQNAGEENNYIFGARVEDIEKIKSTYDPKKIYNSDPKIKRCLDALVNGTLSDNNTGIFRELYASILDGASWHKADNYYFSSFNI